MAAMRFKWDNQYLGQQLPIFAQQYLYRHMRENEPGGVATAISGFNISHNHNWRTDIKIVIPPFHAGNRQLSKPINGNTGARRA